MASAPKARGVATGPRRSDLVDGALAEMTRELGRLDTEQRIVMIGILNRLLDDAPRRLCLECPLQWQ